MAPRRLSLDRTLGPVVVRWIEDNLVHGPGDVQGQPIELDDEQVGFLLRAYQVNDRGRRVIRRAVFSRAKGRAKSELAAMIACAEALGPVRFNGWGHEGRPEGRPVQGPVVLCVATEEGQAGNTYGAVEFMLREGPISALAGLDVGQTRTFVPGGGVIRPITAKASSKEGGRETHVSFGETHLYTTPELKRLHETLRRNLAKRKAAEPWALEETTMFAPDEDSVAEHSHAYAVAIRDGQINDPSFLFDHRQGPAEFDFSDDEQLRAALVEAYGAAAEWMDMERLILEARDPQTRESDFRRYFLNQPVKRDEGTWFTPAEWDACCDPDATIPDGSEVVVGVDIGLVHDASAVAVAWKRVDGRIVVEAKTWAAKPDAVADVHVPGGSVNLEQVEEHVRELAERFVVREVAYDPRFFVRSAELLRGEGITTVEIVQSSSTMADAYAAFYAAVLEQRVAHAGRRTLTAHVMATAATLSDRGWRVRKIKQTGRIDACVAAVMAVHRAEAPEPVAPWLGWDP